VQLPDGLDLDVFIVPPSMTKLNLGSEKKAAKRKKKRVQETVAVEYTFDPVIPAQEPLLEDDLDSIPIVKLEVPTLDLFSSRREASTARPTVDTAGEMPDLLPLSIPSKSATPSQPLTPVLSPQAVQVVRTKKSAKSKKGASSRQQTLAP